MTIGVRERFGEIATLRAIGVARAAAPPRHRRRGPRASAPVGCALGLPLGLWMAARLDRILLAFPGIPARLSFFVFDPARLALALGGVVAIGALAGLLPGGGALRAPLGPRAPRGGGVRSPRPSHPPPVIRYDPLSVDG